MEFKSITITNFLSYFDENEIEFSPYTTIFIGQNKTGKSKLFDAINFVLYGRIFLTDKGENGEWIEWTREKKEIATIVLNNHKKKVALEAGESGVEVSVSLNMDNGDNILVAERTISYTLNGSNYEYSSCSFRLNEIDALSGNPVFSDVGEAAENRLKKYFASSIKDFFLFQGEAASRIMQLKKNGNFSTAVREIARLSVFEKASMCADSYVKHISLIIAKKAGKGAKKKKEREDIQANIDKEEIALKRYEEKRDEADANLSEYSSKLGELESELSEMKEFEDWFKQKETFKENEKRIDRDLKFAESQKSEIAVDSVFYKVRDKIASFKTFYEKLEQKGEVPPSIPVAEIKKALDCCRCTICGTDLSEGSDARNFALGRVPKCNADGLGKYLRELNTTFGDETDEVSQIPQKLQSVLVKKRELDEKRRELRKQKEELTNILSKIAIDDSVSEEKKQHVDELRQSVSRYTSLCERARTDVATNQGSINSIENRIREYRKDLSKVFDDDDDIEPKDKIENYFAQKVCSVMQKLKNIANETAYNSVQEKADEYYKEMTKKNSALPGTIKIDTDSSEIYTVDEEGVRIRNINQGNRISIQLAVIAGILSVAEEQFGQQYPFVTDAPVSALGGDNKVCTIQTMINAFEQSVIIIKDDSSSENKSNDEIRKLINDEKNIGIAYELSLCKAETSSDQYTVLKRIKG
ncbi:MAG: AAA family ATPase [Treponema sp.]|nr:AAA family ATPase [Treponema sp.]